MKKKQWNPWIFFSAIYRCSVTPFITIVTGPTGDDGDLFFHRPVATSFTIFLVMGLSSSNLRSWLTLAQITSRIGLKVCISRSILKVNQIWIIAISQEVQRTIPQFWMIKRSLLEKAVFGEDLLLWMVFGLLGQKEPTIFWMVVIPFQGINTPSECSSFWAFGTWGFGQVPFRKNPGPSRLSRIHGLNPLPFLGHTWIP